MQKERLPKGSPIVKENSVNLEEKNLRFTLINARIFRVLIDEVDEALANYVNTFNDKGKL